eukprot:GFYU01000117.1.p1 GENE.GFYU01000117.1~~GFYU01000117.1.p1  ORF type:complete len:216 (+),score=69.50 GFYU01000117.1:154-801(+)
MSTLPAALDALINEGSNPYNDSNREEEWIRELEHEIIEASKPSYCRLSTQEKFEIDLTNLENDNAILESEVDDAKSSVPSVQGKIAGQVTTGDDEYGDESRLEQELEQDLATEIALEATHESQDSSSVGPAVETVSNDGDVVAGASANAVAAANSESEADIQLMADMEKVLAEELEQEIQTLESVPELNGEDLERLEGLLRNLQVVASAERLKGC